MKTPRRVRSVHSRAYLATMKPKSMDKADPDESAALADSLSKEQSAAKEKLQAALNRYTDARPAELDRQLEEPAKGQPQEPKKRIKPPSDFWSASV